MNKTRQSHANVKLISISLAVVIITLVLLFTLMPRKIDQINLLQQIPRAYSLYGGLTLDMDGAPGETFWLRKGFGLPIDNNNAKDGKGRQAWRWFDLALERWQARNISMELGIYMAPGTDSLTFLVNDKQVTTTATIPGYQVLNFQIPDEYLTPGSNKVTVKINGGNQDALVDYIRWHLGSSDALAKPETDTRLIDGNQLPVIGSSGPYEMNYYLAAPLNSRLQLTLGHDGSGSSAKGSKLRIWYRGYASSGKLLWEGEYPANGTKKLDLYLNNFQDEIVLISFYFNPNPNSDDWFYIASPQLVFPAQPPAPQPGPPLVMNDKAPRTVVLIIQDAMRRDMLSVYGNEVVQTPNLEKIANSGVVFENCYSPSNWTHSSFSSIFTSLPFTRNGAIGKVAVMVDDVPTLAEILSNNNWHTAFFTSNALTTHHQGIARGFEQLYTLYDYVLNQDKFTIADYLPWLDLYLDRLSEKDDAFIAIHLMDTHQTVIAPNKYIIKYAMLYGKILEQMPWLPKSKVAFSVKVVGWIIPHYAVETYFDDQLPNLIDAINKHRDPKNTVYFLLSDHGEELLDHNAFDHGETLFNEIIHIPMIVWGDGVVPSRCKQYISSLDLMPTILDLAGIKSPDGIEGISFAGKLAGDETVQPRPIFISVARGRSYQKAIVFDPWKLTYNDNMPELFNLASDPKEMHNQYITNEIVYGYMRGILKEWWLSIFAQGVNENKNQLSLPERDIEILKGLGYMQK